VYKQSLRVSYSRDAGTAAATGQCLSTVNTQQSVCRGLALHSASTHFPVRSPHTISQSWLKKSKADVFTHHVHYRATLTGLVLHYQWPVSLTCRPTSLRVPCCCLCQSATLCNNSNIMESQWSGYCCCFDVCQVFTWTDYPYIVYRLLCRSSKT